MKIHLVLLVETAIDAKDDADYERKRDALIAEFEKKGYTVSVEGEEEEEEDDGSEEEGGEEEESGEEE